MKAKHIRMIKGLTQFDVYRRTGISQGRLSAIERGQAKPRPDEKKAIEKALNYPVDWGNE